MSKGNSKWTEKKIERYYKEGRGQGEGTNYQPWLTTQDCSPESRVHRINGWKTSREHHLLSDLECDYFYILEWADNVIDIREQFPLDREKTISIAEEIGIKHPMYPKTKVATVMTTDFLITVQDGMNKKQVARTIKPYTKLNETRVIEKFEIERLYWSSLNIDWGIVTDKELNSVLAENISWLHKPYHLDEYSSNNLELLSLIKSRIMDRKDSVLNFTQDLDEEMNLESGTALFLFRHLLARKEIRGDMFKEMNTSLLLESFSLNTFSVQKGAKSF